MKPLFSLLIGLYCASPLAAETLLVENGQPRAVIVVAPSPPRTVRLAAQELQDTVEKISGAHLPIVTQPDLAATAAIYVGRSPHTDRLQITADGLRDGAYRIVSGDGWLVLIGQDTELRRLSRGRNNADIVSGKTSSREWDQITALWALRTRRSTRTASRCRATRDCQTKSEEPGRNSRRWRFGASTSRGSFNAVCGFLMKLGARWHAPGELGEVLPSLRTIRLPEVDETVRPDFPIRRFNVRFGVHGRDLAMWAMRLMLAIPTASRLPTAWPR